MLNSGQDIGFLFSLIIFEEVKSITNILLFCFITLTVAPASLMLVNSLKSQCDPDSYRSECVMMEEGESCPIADMECCPGMCNPAQCCYCCFLCIVDNKKLEIKIFESNINKQNTDDQFDLSDFSSDCWQPPRSDFDSHRLNTVCSVTEEKLARA